MDKCSQEKKHSLRQVATIDTQQASSVFHFNGSVSLTILSLLKTTQIGQEKKKLLATAT